MPERSRRLTLAALFAVSGASLAGEQADPGHRLAERHCIGCHKTEVYTRSDRRMTSKDGLQAQVGRCEQALDLRWFDDDIQAVTEYLNREYYRFP